MGICCVKQVGQEQGELRRAGEDETTYGISLFKDNNDAILKIVKIQSAIRGFRARKQLAELKEYCGRPQKLLEIDGVVDLTNMASPNPRVAELEAKLGPFNSCSASSSKTVKREIREPILLANGAKYAGEWDVETGKRDGFGMQLWADGSKYEGYWHDDMANGKGRLIHIDGDVYEGYWKDDKAHGKGKYIHYDGAVYYRSHTKIDMKEIGQWTNRKEEGMKPGLTALDMRATTLMAKSTVKDTSNGPMGLPTLATSQTTTFTDMVIFPHKISANRSLRVERREKVRGRVGKQQNARKRNFLLARWEKI
eukprot:TRINITY_DN51_c0_g1_i1.p2 TRINITY_DN51_c0_g1~~TRINITY_DN51_c0_g1_i1.p2  ORF type:complete len:309 (+),score=26.64 TRINITY_DN51_c0_g1_i1:1133-2059(+)